MPIVIKSIKGYYYLDAWIMANIIQIGTERFANRYLNKSNDPCGRMYDQMTMAARSVTANIAEGASRRQTSHETEMKLTDVARASLSELLGDFFHFSLMANIEPWPKTSAQYQSFNAIQLDLPDYGEDIQHDAWIHIQRQYGKFAGWIENAAASTCINSLMLLINRLIQILQKMISRQLESFKEEGGFTENLTKERVETIKQQSLEANAPTCPVCGKSMQKVMAKKGRNSGKEFWSCTSYPDCMGTRSIL